MNENALLYFTWMAVISRIFSYLLHFKLMMELIVFQFVVVRSEDGSKSKTKQNEHAEKKKK